MRNRDWSSDVCSSDLGGDSGEPELLAACYANSLQLGAEHEVSSIAFPAISCGVFGYPHALAAEVAIGQLRAWDGPLPSRALLACHESGTAREYRRLLAGSPRVAPPKVVGWDRRRDHQ